MCDQFSKREHFHSLVNLDSYLEPFSCVCKIAPHYLYKFGSEPDFEYEKLKFAHWLHEQYNQGIQAMHSEHWLDSGHILDGRRVGKFSDLAMKERLVQHAPNNLVDGVWLDRIMPCGEATEVEALLSQIRYEETGSGNVERNHSNIYKKLLESQDTWLPSVYSREFSEYSRFLDSAFDQPLLQLAVRIFPRKFLPEILGMTLWIEWNATPASCLLSRCLRKRGIDNTFYKIHQQADNPRSGHGFLARRAIELYLENARKEGEDIQEYWRRIWRGYSTWDTLSKNFEIELQIHLLRFDEKG